MKVRRSHHGGRVVGKATSVKKRSGSIRKTVKKKNLKSKKKITNGADRKNVVVPSPLEMSPVENIPVPTCSTETSREPPISRVPLIIDSPVSGSGMPAFNLSSLMDFEAPDVEVKITRAKKVKPRKKKHSTGVIQREVTSDEDKNIQLFPVREWGLVIVILPHPKTIRFFGLAQIQVISGAVNILGSVLVPKHGIVSAFSSSNVMCLDVKTESTESICRQASRLQIVKDSLLTNKVPELLADKILNSCDNSSVIVGFRKNFRNTDVHFVTSLMPNAFPAKLKKKEVRPSDLKDFGFNICLQNSGMDFSQCESFIDDIISSIKESDEQKLPAPRVVVQGMRNVGKSTFLRYAVNRLLNLTECVYYLDADPGQSEFTPAGCVSLVKVTSPILGPPFTHQTTPEKMYFLGTAAVQDVADKYSYCVQLLSEHYKKNFLTTPLFVNTMGWVMGMGLKLLEELKSNVLPTHVVKIVDDQLRGSHSKFRIPPEPADSGAKEFLYKQFVPESRIKELMHSADCRDLSILAYLGKCQKLHDSVRTFNSISPYCVLWKDVALCIGDQKYATEHILYAFNGSWVALLSVDESLIMESDSPVLPKLLTVEPVGQECYGFGVIRAIDVGKRAFYITTPEPLERLKNVNVLMKGNVQLPVVLYTKQKIPGKQIPYVARVEGESSIASKHISRRKYRPKKSEMEDQ